VQSATEPTASFYFRSFCLPPESSTIGTARAKSHPAEAFWLLATAKPDSRQAVFQQNRHSTLCCLPMDPNSAIATAIHLPTEAQLSQTKAPGSELNRLVPLGKAGMHPLHHRRMNVN
jgi:hypothetical protein